MVDAYREEKDRNMELESVNSKASITPRSAMMNADIKSHRSNSHKSAERKKPGSIAKKLLQAKDKILRK